MTKRLIELDDDLLEAARSASGQTTITGTVVEALEQMVRRREFREYLEDLKGGLARDLDDPDVIRAAQR